MVELRRERKQVQCELQALTSKKIPTSILDQILQENQDLLDPITRTIMTHPIVLELETAENKTLHKTYDLNPLKDALKQANTSQGKYCEPFTGYPIKSGLVFADIEKWNRVH
jgi:hypothetical protein